MDYMEKVSFCPKEKARKERAIKEEMLNMSSKEVAEFLVEWTTSNITCTAQLRYFLSRLVRKIRKVQPWIGKVDLED